MGKKKSKKQEHDQDQGNQEFLGLNAKQIGVTVAGIIVGELVQAATQRLMESDDGADDDGDDGNRLKPVQSAKAVAAKAGSQMEEAGSTVADAAHTVQASASNVPSYLGELVEVLQDVGQRLKDKSVSGLSNSPDAIADSITTTTRNAIHALTSNGNLALLDKTDKKASKSKKKGKKKKKKKKG